MAATAQETLGQTLVALTPEGRESVIHFLQEIQDFEKYVTTGQFTTLRLNGGAVKVTKGASAFTVTLASP